MIGGFICTVALSVLGAESAINKTQGNAARKAAAQNGEIFYYDHGQLRTVRNNKKVKSCFDEYSGHKMYCYTDDVYSWAGNVIVIPELYAREKTEEYSLKLAQKENLGIIISPYDPKTKIGRYCDAGDSDTYNVLPFGWATFDIESKRPCYFDWLIINDKVKMFLRYVDYNRMTIFKSLPSVKELGEVDLDGYRDNPVFLDMKNRHTIINHKDYIDNVIKYYKNHKNDWKYDQTLV